MDKPSVRLNIVCSFCVLIPYPYMVAKNLTREKPFFILSITLTVIDKTAPNFTPD